MAASRISVRPAGTSVLVDVHGEREILSVSKPQLKLALHCTPVSGVHSTNRLAQQLYVCATHFLRMCEF